MQKDFNKDNLEEKLIQIKRVSKKTKGGNKIAFTALTVVGNKAGKVGIGLEKALDVPSAITKSTSKARRSMVDVNLKEGTIPHQVSIKFGACRIVLKPAPIGAGIKAGGQVRKVLDAVGIRDISAKIVKSANTTNSIYAVFEALKKLKA